MRKAEIKAIIDSSIASGNYVAIVPVKHASIDYKAVIDSVITGDIEDYATLPPAIIALSAAVASAYTYNNGELFYTREYISEFIDDEEIIDIEESIHRPTALVYIEEESPNNFAIKDFITGKTYTIAEFTFIFGE